MIRIAFRLRIVVITGIDPHSVVRLVVGHNQLPEMISYLEMNRRGLLIPDRSNGTHPFLSRILKGILNVVSTIGVRWCTASASPPPIILSFGVLMNISHILARDEIDDDERVLPVIQRCCPESD